MAYSDARNKTPLSSRWLQMSKQEQIIERKKQEIQLKIAAQKQAAAQAGNRTSAKNEKKTNIFSNDGSFMNQFKALLEKQQKTQKGDEESSPAAAEAVRANVTSEATDRRERGKDRERESRRNPGGDRHGRRRSFSRERRDRRHSGDRESRDRRSQRQSNDKNRPPQDRDRDRSPLPPPPPSHLPPGEHQAPPSQQDISDAHPPQLQYPKIPPNGPPEPPNDQQPISPWNNSAPDMPFDMPPLPPMGSNFGPGPNMGQGPHMGPGNNMGPRPNMRPGPNMFPGPPRMMNGPPNRPPNFPNMPPNFSPGMMGPNMGGPNMSMLPLPPFFGPPPPNMMGPNGPPHPNSMMPPNSMNGNIPPFMGMRPPFGMPPNGPPPNSMGFENRQQPNVPFLPPPPLPIHIPEPKPMEAVSIPPPEPMKIQNIPPPMPMPLTHIPKPKDLDLGNIPPPPSGSSQVLSADGAAAAERAAREVARNGDHWEHVLKAMSAQDQTLWFLHDPNSKEYEQYRNMVSEYRNEVKSAVEVKPEDKYEPEFSLEDDYSDDDDNLNAKSENSQDNTDAKPIAVKSEANESKAGLKKELGSSQSDDDESNKERQRKKRKSRWGEEGDVKPDIPLPPITVLPPITTFPPLPNLPPMPNMPPLPSMPPMPNMPTMPNMPPMPNLPAMGTKLGIPEGARLAPLGGDGLQLTGVNRSNHALMQYAMTNYGSTNLSPEDWKKCEDNFKLNLLFQDMMKKRAEIEKLEQAGKHKYDYDSDEDTEAGTWEHKLRAREMNATEKWADELTKQAAGKHHIGDFLPPEELKKFMEKYSAIKGGKEPDLSDYKEFKLTEQNIGFKMLQKLGWNQGQGLGAEGTGIVDPVNKTNQPGGNAGLGVAAADNVSADDDEFDAYRKRMMLAYRFRPNPLNNPRRPYY